MIFDQVGWLLELTVDHVVISAVVGEKLIAARDRIPLGMVRTITEYREGEGALVALPRRRKSPA